MTAKEKARELVGKYKNPIIEYPKEENIYYKQCAIIAVDEIIKDNEDLLGFMHCNSDNLEIKQNIQYWQEVKTETQKL